MYNFKISYGQYPLIFLNTLIIVYALGIYTARNNDLPYKCLFLLLIVNFLLSFYLAWKKSSWTGAAVLCLFSILGTVQGSASLTLPADNISHYEQQRITVTGKVCETPVVKQDHEGNYRVTYIVDTDKISAPTAAKVSGKIYIYKKYTAEADLAALPQINDTIKTSGNLRLIHGYHNPGQLNSELMAAQKGIYASLSANKAAVEILSNDNSFSLNRISSDIRTHILTSLSKAMPEDDASLIYAMLFGGYSNISPELLDAFTTTGIMHILSVSGSHISLLAGFILNLGRLLHMPRRFNMLLLILFISFYAVLCGCTPPVMRAAIMGLLSALAINLHKQHEACHLLTLTALVMLLFEPLLLFNISFQLSFMATAGLVYIMPYLQTKCASLPAFLADNIALTMSAQLAVLPLIAWYFNSVSLSSLIANLIVVPPLEFVIVIGLIGSVFGFILPVLQQIIFIIASLALGFAAVLTIRLAQLPLASVYVPTIPFSIIVIYYLCWFILLNQKLSRQISHQFKLHKTKFFTISALVILIFSYFYANRQAMLQVHFIDVGQGDAALIITPQKRSVLIDTGGTLNSDFDIGARVVIPYLKHHGITQLDYLILSHSDADHAGGAAVIWQKIPVNHLIISAEKTALYLQILKISPDNPLWQKTIIAADGMHFSLDNVQFEFLHAPTMNAGKSGNDASNVLKLSYQNFSVLFTGDLPSSEEAVLLQKVPKSTLQSTVLKVAHHGSNTSSSEAFLQAVNPQFAVISAGKYNSFGHPTAAVLQRLNDLPTNILRTDESGAITFFTDGKTLRLKTFE